MGYVAGCQCRRCWLWNNPTPIWGIGSGFYWGIMHVCGTCGNKRCPGAADHENKCSGSNEPGQRGSLYQEQTLP